MAQLYVAYLYMMGSPVLTNGTVAMAYLYMMGSPVLTNGSVAMAYLYMMGSPVLTCVEPDTRAPLQGLHSGLGPTLVLIPDLVLPSQLVSSM